MRVLSEPDMTPATLLQRFRGIWRALQKDPDSRYPELPPGPLLKRVGLDFSCVNDSELKRAQWFWNRRPRSKLLESDLYFGIYLCSGLLLLLVPSIGVLLAVVWIVSAYLRLLLDTASLANWRSEYEVSVERLLRTHTSLEK